MDDDELEKSILCPPLHAARAPMTAAAGIDACIEQVQEDHPYTCDELLYLPLHDSASFLLAHRAQNVYLLCVCVLCVCMCRDECACEREYASQRWLLVLLANICTFVCVCAGAEDFCMHEELEFIRNEEGVLWAM